MYLAKIIFINGPEKNTRCTCLSPIILLASWNGRWNSVTTFVNRGGGGGELLKVHRQKTCVLQTHRRDL